MSPATNAPIEHPKRPLMQRRFVGTALCCAAIVAAGLLAYSDSLHGPFIFDDSGFFCLVGAERASPPAHPGRAAAGRGPDLRAQLLARRDGRLADTIVLNLAIHLLAALTLFGVARRTLELPAVARRFGERASTPVAFCIALLWMVHPLLTQSVTYLVAAGGVAHGALFPADAVLFHPRGLIAAAGDGNGIAVLTAKTRKREKRRRNGPQTPSISSASFALSRFRGQNAVVMWSVFAVAACALGMGCKQVMVAAPRGGAALRPVLPRRLVPRGASAAMGTVPGAGGHVADPGRLGLHGVLAAPVRRPGSRCRASRRCVTRGMRRASSCTISGWPSGRADCAWTTAGRSP